VHLHLSTLSPPERDEQAEFEDQSWDHADDVSVELGNCSRH